MVSVTQSLARNPRSLRAAVRFCVPSACCVHPALPVPASLSAGINRGSKCLKSSAMQSVLGTKTGAAWFVTVHVCSAFRRELMAGRHDLSFWLFHSKKKL